jgi:DNA mismatch repair protein MLH3
MFNDPLTLEKCSLLIRQLGQTSFPFICAHGRPSIYPLVRLAPQSRVSQDDSIVWKAVTLQRWFPVRDDKRD